MIVVMKRSCLQLHWWRMEEHRLWTSVQPAASCWAPWLAENVVFGGTCFFSERGVANKARDDIRKPR